MKTIIQLFAVAVFSLFFSAIVSAETLTTVATWEAQAIKQSGVVEADRSDITSEGKVLNTKELTENGYSAQTVIETVKEHAYVQTKDGSLKKMPVENKMTKVVYFWN